MTKTLISETAVRELIREAFETPPAFDATIITSDEELPIVINPSVDDQLGAVELSPVDIQFVPHNTVEFGIAVKQMSKNIPDEVIPMLYAKVREIMMDAQETYDGPDDQGDTEEMEKRQNSRLGMEEAVIRKAIRGMIKEAEMPFTIAGGKPSHKRTAMDDEIDDEIELAQVLNDPDRWDDVTDVEGLAAHHAQADREEDAQEFGDDPFDTSDVDAETTSEWDPEPAEAPAKHNRKESETGYGVEGDQLRKLAAELGISTAGAKRLMNTGLAKLKYMADLSDADVKDIVHGAARDWVEKLVDKDRLSDAEGRTWLRHLDIVAQNDEFRDFLDSYVKAEMDKDDEWPYAEDPSTQKGYDPATKKGGTPGTGKVRHRSLFGKPVKGGDKEED